MADRLLFHCTHGEDDPERATVPYIAASVAAASGHDVVVVCTADGVWTGTEGYADRVHHAGMAPLRELYDQFVDAGGEVWLCSACVNVREITEEQCAAGARIVGAAQIVEAIADGGRSITLT